MIDRYEKDQPGLEVDRTKEAPCTIYHVTNDELEHRGSSNDLSPTSGEHTLRHNPCGLRPLWFGILIAVITTVVVGAAIGGSIGGTMANSSSKPLAASQSSYPISGLATVTVTPSSSTSSVSRTTDATSTATQAGEYTPLAPSAVRLLEHPCPSENYLYQINDDPFPPQLFKWACGTAFEGNGRGEVGITLMQLSAYTAEQCVEACGGLNAWRNEQICSAVTFQASMSSEWNVGRGNCWLFNGTESTWDDPGAKTCISASI